jgi:hypothetical protein
MSNFIRSHMSETATAVAAVAFAASAVGIYAIEHLYLGPAKAATVAYGAAKEHPVPISCIDLIRDESIKPADAIEASQTECSGASKTAVKEVVRFVDVENRLSNTETGFVAISGSSAVLGASFASMVLTKRRQRRQTRA